jgi:hypothetical protein
MTMNHAMGSRLMGLVAAVPGLLALAGCDSTGNARYTPTRVEARSSLEAALTAWRDGKPYGPIDATPPVNVADSAWQGGAKIEAFEIGEEEDPGDGTKQFPVKLTMKDAKSVHQDVRYIVNGRDPVWVFSEPDYKKMIDMGNGPDSRKKAVPARSRRR